MVAQAGSRSGGSPQLQTSLHWRGAGLMERETEGTVPPSPRPPEVGVGRGSRDCAGEWGQPSERPACQMCLWLLDLVCGTFSSLTSQPGACALPLCHGGSCLERAQVRSRGRCCGFPWLLGPDGVVGGQSGPCLSLP